MKLISSCFLLFNLFASWVFPSLDQTKVGGSSPGKYLQFLQKTLSPSDRDVIKKEISCDSLLLQLLLSSNFLKVANIPPGSKYWHGEFKKRKFSCEISQFDKKHRAMIRLITRESNVTDSSNVNHEYFAPLTLSWFAIDSINNKLFVLRLKDGKYLSVKCNRQLLKKVVIDCINWEAEK